jgi:hypothetical protein
MTQETCRNVGELTVGGKTVGLIRCDLPAGHDEPHPLVLDVLGNEVEPHRAVLEWSVEGEGVNLIDWPEANDPAERFDVEVPIAPVGVCPVESCLLDAGHVGGCVLEMRDDAGR